MASISKQSDRIFGALAYGLFQQINKLEPSNGFMKRSNYLFGAKRARKQINMLPPIEASTRG
jgi:hypothetical protein